MHCKYTYKYVYINIYLKTDIEDSHKIYLPVAYRLEGYRLETPTEVLFLLRIYSGESHISLQGTKINTYRKSNTGVNLQCNIESKREMEAPYYTH